MQRYILIPSNHNTMILIDNLKNKCKIHSIIVDEHFINILEQNGIYSFSKVVV